MLGHELASAVVHKAMSRLLGVWHNLRSDADDLGAHANRFTRNQLQSVASITMD